MNELLRHATPADAPELSRLVQTSFLAYIAPDWEAQGRQEFLDENTAEKLAAKILNAALCLLCERDGQAVGVIFLPRPTLVQLFFVEPSCIGQGIGRALWEAAREAIERQHPDVKTVELNSSPYALNVYRALGFYPISEPYRRKGAVATRMACWLPGRGLEKANGA